jgi:pyrroline-5-carboxylate reductase
MGIVMRIGFIGYGKMGSVIINALLENKGVKPNQLIVYNRTSAKLKQLLTNYPTLTIADTPTKVAESSELIFICTLTGAIPAILKDISKIIQPSTHLVLISGALNFSYLEKQFPGAITKTIPSITLLSSRGITLACHNNKVTPQQKETLKKILGSASKLVEVSEDQLDDGADLTSTFPAFIAKMMDTWAKACADSSGYSKEQALKLVLETLVGTAALLTDKGYTPKAVMERVATKGGNTEQGLKVLDEKLPPLFSDVVKATRKRRREAKAATAKLAKE